jgi:cysteine desulfurase/selenocysteine lyase
VRILGAKGGGTPLPRIPLVAMELPQEGLDAETIARTIADTSGVIVSAGQHCTHPLHAHVRTGATLRASAWLFNTLDDIERLVAGLRTLVA